MENLLALQEHLARTVGRELCGDLETARAHLAVLVGLKAALSGESISVFVSMTEAIPRAEVQELDAIFTALLRYDSTQRFEAIS